MTLKRKFSRTLILLSKVAIVRSMRSWALVHNLAQTWTQIGRSPAAALGDVAPNVGSVVSLEKERERTASQVFPTFLALNAGSAVGPGYFSATYAPFKVIPQTTGLQTQRILMAQCGWIAACAFSIPLMTLCASTPPLASLHRIMMRSILPHVA